MREIIKCICCFMLIAFYSPCVYSQELIEQKRKNMINTFVTRITSPEDKLLAYHLISQKRRVDNLIRKDSVLSKMKGQNCFYFYVFYPDSFALTKKNLMDYTFLKHLNLGGILTHDVGGRPIITDSTGKLVAYGDSRMLYCVPPYKSKWLKEPARHFFIHQPKLIFCFSVITDFYICVIDEKLFVADVHSGAFISWEKWISTDGFGGISGDGSP